MNMVIEMIVPLIVREFIKVFSVIIFSNFIYIKITNIDTFSKKQVICFTLLDLCLSISFVLLIEYASQTAIFIVASLINGAVLMIITKNIKRHFILPYVLSIIISYALYGFALIISGLLLIFVAPGLNYDSVMCVVTIWAVYMLFFYFVMKSKRIRRGFNFLNKININIVYYVLIFTIIMIVVFELMPKDAPYAVQQSMLVLTVFVDILFFMFIKDLITKHYKRNMRDRTINIQKEEIDANVKVIEELKEQNLKLSTTIHKYNHRLSALENSIRKVMDRSNAEFASELSIVLEQTRRVEAQFAEETKVQVELPSTNVIAIDNMLEYMRNEAIKSNIDFTLKLSDSIIPLLDKHISEDKFETLLADHIKDAIIAIKSKAEGYKSILVLIGIVDGAYELSIYDTGVEFDIPTLLKLGTEPVTTHKDKGGSGLGFMTTFETLKCSRASLVIEEYDSNVTNYTKSVTIRFDGKCEYRIYSYRADDIKKACGNRSRIKIKKI